MAYLHGAETTEVTKGPVPIRVVNSAVIAIIGTAPTGDRNTLTLCSSQEEDAAFGKPLPGFTIPKALETLRAEGAGAIMVVNVMVDATHLVAVVAEAHVVTNGKTKTTHAPIKDIVVRNADDEVMVADTDYEIDEYGNIQILDFTDIAEGSTIEVDYKKFDASLVTNAHIIGTVDAGTDARTGTKCLAQAYSLFGIKPKILIIPGFSSITAIATEMKSLADTYKAVYLIDAPAATTKAVAIAGRGPAGAINFYTSSGRAILCYPMVQAYDIATDANENRPLSTVVAGIMARVDEEEGYWVSPSNHESNTILGLERTISWAINDPNSDANALNAVGICTIASGFGTGYRVWGNRTALYPSSSAPVNFIPVRRTADVVHESLELGALPFIDKPITNAVIDAILESGNIFVRTLIGRDALIQGSRIEWDKAYNSAADIAAGKLKYKLVQMVPTPLETLTYESFLDISLLNNLSAA
jgi:uncharacterized protein